MRLSKTLFLVTGTYYDVNQAKNYTSVGNTYSMGLDKLHITRLVAVNPDLTLTYYPVYRAPGHNFESITAVIANAGFPADINIDLGILTNASADSGIYYKNDVLSTDDALSLIARGSLFIEFYTPLQTIVFVGGTINEYGAKQGRLYASVYTDPASPLLTESHITNVLGNPIPVHSTDIAHIDDLPPLAASDAGEVIYPFLYRS